MIRYCLRLRGFTGRRLAAAVSAVCLAAVACLSGSSLSSAADAADPAAQQMVPSVGAEKPELTFAVMSDLHINASDPQSARLFQQALLDYQEINPNLDLIILNGDLTEGAPADYAKLEQILEEVPHAPVQAVMGNHDYYLMWKQRNGHYDYGGRLSPNWDSARAVKLFTERFGYDQVYHHAWIKNRMFLFLSGEMYRDVDETVAEDAYISRQQLAWLGRMLYEHSHRPGPKPRPVFAFLHQPLPDTVGGSRGQRGVVQHRELRQMFSRFPELVLFTGHTHWGADTEQFRQGPFTMVGCSSIRVVYDRADQPASGSRSESIYVETYKDKVVVYVREHETRNWIGSPRVIKL